MAPQQRSGNFSSRVADFVGMDKGEIGTLRAVLG